MTRNTTSLRLLTSTALVLVLALGAAVLAACGQSSAMLAGRTFLSIAATDHGAPRALVAGTEIRITFQDATFSGSGGCNTLGGDYRIEGGRLVVDSLSTTEMGCDAARMAQDDWLSGLLGARPAIALVGDDLTLDTGDLVLKLRDRRVVVPDVTLAGPTWVVESLISGDTVSSVPNGLRATLIFRADGTVDVDDGCNTGSGTWTAVAPGVRISDLATTKRACEGAAGQLETTILETLRAGVLAASIDGNQLVLRVGTRGLQLRAG